MGRIETREELFKLVFEFSLTKEKDSERLQEIEENNKIDQQYILKAYNGIIENYNSLTEEISRFTNGYNIDRVFKVDLALLVVALYEIKFEEEIPTAVSINEALNLAKKYSTDKSAGFINGVLANFAK